MQALRHFSYALPWRHKKTSLHQALRKASTNSISGQYVRISKVSDVRSFRRVAFQMVRRLCPDQRTALMLLLALGMPFMAQAQVFPAYSDPTAALSRLQDAVVSDRQGSDREAIHAYEDALKTGHVFMYGGDDIALAARLRLAQLLSRANETERALGPAAEAFTIIGQGSPQYNDLVTTAQLYVTPMLRASGLRGWAEAAAGNQRTGGTVLSDVQVLQFLETEIRGLDQRATAPLNSHIDFRTEVFRKTRLVHLIARTWQGEKRNDLLKAGFAEAARHLPLSEPYMIETGMNVLNQIANERALNDEEMATLRNLFDVARTTLGPASEMRQALRYLLSRQREMQSMPDTLLQLSTAQTQLSIDVELLSGVVSRSDRQLETRTARVVEVAHRVRQLALEALTLDETTLADYGTNSKILRDTAFRAAQLETLGPVSNAIRSARIRAAARDADMWYTHNFDGQVGHASRLKEDLSAAVADRSLDRIPGIVEDLERMRTFTQFGEAKLSAAIPGFHELIRPATVGQGELFAGAPGGYGAATALILISSGPEKTDKLPVIFVVTEDGLAFSEADWSRSRFADAIARYRQSILGGARLNDQIALRAPISPLDTSPAIDLDLTLGSEIFDRLFGGPELVAALDGKKRWVIVTNGPFHALPFAALPMERTAAFGSVTADMLRQVPWLGTQREISLKSALSDVVREQRRDAPAMRDGYVGFGDPEFNGAPGPVRAAQYAEVDAGASRIRAISALPRLPSSAREIRNTARFFPQDATAIRLGARANEAELHFLSASGALRGLGILHFATHGLVAGKGDESFGAALALSPPFKSQGLDPGLVNDGLLTLDEIGLLQIEADWVVLSACNTAAGAGSSGEALTGLARTFLLSGAENLLATHWPIEDVVAQQIVTETLQSTRAGRAPSASLLAAINTVMADTSRDGTALPASHPSVWAPFILYEAD